MATTTGRGASVKRHADEAQHVVRDQIEEPARAGARQMLLAALEDEVNGYLRRGRYERCVAAGPAGDSAASGVRRPGSRGYRNGTTPRRLTLGSGTVPLDVPRVRDIPPGQEPFESKILLKYQRRRDTIDETFVRLFIEGLATRDFEPALRLLAGSDAPLSPSTISRLMQQFRSAYTAFHRQDLSDRNFVYIWADGIYVQAGLGTEKACLMVLIGADTAGQKHLIALREGYRESAESWGALLKDPRLRGGRLPAAGPERAGLLDRGRGVGAVGGGERTESQLGPAALHEPQDHERDRQAAQGRATRGHDARAGDLAGPE